MSIKDAIERGRHSRSRRQARRMAPYIAFALQAAEQSRWRQLVSLMGPDIYHLVEVKWQLPAGWGGGDPPRPRSAQEMADTLGANVGVVRSKDWVCIDFFRDVRRYDRWFPDFLTVPIDDAQGWWDRQLAWLHNPNGSRRPEGQQAPHPPLYPPEAGDRHEIEEADELQRHLLEVHRLEYVRDGPSPLRSDHPSAHDDEAQDRRWDQLLRP